jgi:phosphopantetheinyl transferase (holo-ACP synthase)
MTRSVSLFTKDISLPAITLLEGNGIDELKTLARAISKLSDFNQSRSYRDNFALLAEWKNRVGVDIECLCIKDTRYQYYNAGTELNYLEKNMHGYLENSDKDVDLLAEAILTREEKEAISGLDLNDKYSNIIKLWSGKEALAKALGDALSYEPKSLIAPGNWPNASSGCWRYLFFYIYCYTDKFFIISHQDKLITKELLSAYVVSIVYEVR